MSIVRERAGALVVAEVAVAMRTRPLEDTGFDHGVAPSGVGLESVVEGAQRRKVLGARGTGLGSAFGVGVVVVGVDVVDLATAGGSGAVGEHARPIPQDDVVADAVGDGVAVGSQWLVEVDDGFEDDPGVGVGTPGPDLVEQEEALAFLHAAEVVEGDPAVADCGCG